jgi:hypothetical protein
LQLTFFEEEEMPAYSNTLPPSSLWPGAVGSSFSNEAVPASAQAGAQFALIESGGFPQEGRTVAWLTCSPKFSPARS